MCKETGQRSKTGVEVVNSAATVAFVKVWWGHVGMVLGLLILAFLVIKSVFGSRASVAESAAAVAAWTDALVELWGQGSHLGKQELQYYDLEKKMGPSTAKHIWGSYLNVSAKLFDSLLNFFATDRWREKRHCLKLCTHWLPHHTSKDGSIQHSHRSSCLIKWDIK